MKMVHAYDCIPEWRAARARAGRMLLALDFDGTLAPIVPVPDDAALLPGARAALQRLLDREDMLVAVVSGRALEDARARVGLGEIYYAGNHGLEIEGAGVERIHPEALETTHVVAECRAALEAEFRAEPEVLVEDKHLSLSVHFRLVRDEAREQAIRARVERCCGGRRGLRLLEGKKVVEVRPDVEWDKGRATSFLVETLLGSNGIAPVIYIGDDRTDEDAFQALRGRGAGVLVAPHRLEHSAATAWVRSPDEVITLLERLADDA
ncbi:MAG TPA: trehalose-phosphatase [Longimicrobiales bacterium]|nr:trehalose-phosphatase [Longimicrobiales bacterium]